MEPEMQEFAQVLTEREETLRYVTRIFALAGLGSSPMMGATAPQQQKIDGVSILRSLSPLEMETLQTKCRCTCSDWNNLRLLVFSEHRHADESPRLQRLVSDTMFDGVVILDMRSTVVDSDAPPSTIQKWSRLPPGIHSNLLVCDSMFRLASCRVYRNSMISQTYVGAQSVILNCGQVSVSTDGGNKRCGTLDIVVGPESGGGRKLAVAAEHTMIEITHQLRHGPTPSVPNVQTPLDPKFVWNILSNSCLLRDTPTVQNIFLHDQTSIEAATSVTNVLLLPNSFIGNSCTITNVMLQWNAAITDNSIISDAFLMENAHCGPHSIVMESVLGPDVHTSAGEVHASVIGPNTNSHHQSLVIGVLWPLGRGNVGYGANVGSNHTGRLPDQETTSGEGTFWGLSTVIKFPVDLTFAPYTVVAAGTTLPPQRICMPFSLVVGQSHGNDIIPGWVLQSSPYTLARSEKKFATRRKAKRHDFYTGWKIFRPEVMDMCRWAKKQLESGQGGTIPGLGLNNLSDRARDAGIRAYTDGVHRYVLHGLLTWLGGAIQAGTDSTSIMNTLHQILLETTAGIVLVQDPMQHVEWPMFPWDRTTTANSNNETDFEWNYQRSVLVEEFPLENSEIFAWIERLLSKLVTLENDFARRIHKSKSRDDVRGADTIPGYKQAHVTAEDDPVILEARQTAQKTETTVLEILKIFSPGARSRL